MAIESRSLAGWDHAYSGKVRDLYTSPTQPGRVLLVASDRVSAFDHLLEPPIPGKGELLTRLSKWWFGQLTGVPNHLVSDAGRVDGEPVDVAPSGAASVGASSNAVPSSAAFLSASVDAPMAGVASSGAAHPGADPAGADPAGADPADAPPAGADPADPADAPSPVPAEVAERSMLVKTLEMYPIECVVRGYLSGSGWVEYQATQSVCGVALPAGLSDGDRLPEPIFTPAWKAPMGEHDENISFERTVEIVGPEIAAALRDASLDIFTRASAIAEARGVILADTKFEFGDDAGTLTLGDEVLTSDSSRYWDAATYATGNRTASFDKQIVRNWLQANWDMTGTPPVLPPEIVEQTAARYRELISRLTGE
jgi:phosphoribosylaminoimidazole-succinocarboxamide synthase